MTIARNPAAIIRRILFIHNAGLGDAIMASAALRRLKRVFPEAKIDVLARANAVQYLQKLTCVNDVIQYLPESAIKRWPTSAPSLGFHYLRLAARIRSRKYDAVLQWRGQFGDTMLSLLSGASCRIAALTGLIRRSPLGVQNWPLFKGDLVRINDSQTHIVEVFGLVVDRLISRATGIKSLAQILELEVPISQRDEGTVDSFLEKHAVRKNDHLVVISIGSRTNGNDWPPQRFAQVADYLQRDLGVRVVLAGIASQLEIEEEITSCMETVPIRSAGLLDLYELAALSARSRFAITLNSAPMHVAAATKTPIVVLCGRDGSAFVPWNVPHRVVTKNSFYPQRHPDRREWPLLVNRIEAEDVIEAVKDLWVEVMPEKIRENNASTTCVR